MEIVFLLVTILAICIGLFIFREGIILIVGLVARFREVPSLPKKRSQKFSTIDSMGVLLGGETSIGSSGCDSNGDGICD